MKQSVSRFNLTMIVGILLGCSLPNLLSAQNIAGTWQGKLVLPAGSLTLIFHIAHTAEGAYVTSCDSPDQGVKGIPTASTTFQDSLITIQIPTIRASYKGKLNANQTIRGTFTQGIVLPLNLEKGEPPIKKRPQEPQPPFPYRSEEVSVKNSIDGINLAGTLTLPQTGDQFPAVVLVTGSGAQNRDEEIMEHKPFLVIADYLTRNGVAVLRCDDRGTASSQGNHASATNEDFANDAEAALNYLRGRKEIDAKRIGIVGHSCGGTIAFMVGARDEELAFIISLAGAAVKGDSLMLRQVELIFKSVGKTDADWQIMKPSIRQRYALLQQTDKTPDEIRKDVYIDVIKTMSAEALKDPQATQQINEQINSMVSPWYLHFMRYDPTKDLRKIKCPVLALNGEKDIQVDATMNLTAIKERITENGNKRVTTKAYPTLNHLFQSCREGTLAEYGQLEETISPAVLRDMTEWILSY